MDALGRVPLGYEKDERTLRKSTRLRRPKRSGRSMRCTESTRNARQVKAEADRLSRCPSNASPRMDTRTGGLIVPSRTPPLPADQSSLTGRIYRLFQRRVYEGQHPSIIAKLQDAM